MITSYSLPGLQQIATSMNGYKKSQGKDGLGSIMSDPVDMKLLKSADEGINYLKLKQECVESPNNVCNWPMPEEVGSSADGKLAGSAFDVNP